MYTVYRHTAPNGKVYIGITGRKPEKRWDNGNGYKENKHFYRAILKYGWENIEHEIICQAPMSAAQAGAVEKSFIALYDSTNPDKGYNHSIGGEYGFSGMHHSAEARKKMSESHKGKTSPRKGVHLSPETRRKLSESHKGKIPWSKGKHPSPETLRKMSQSRKGVRLSPEVRKKMSESHKGKAAKAVICVETGIMYSSGMEAAKSIGVTNKAISNVVRGVRKTAGGYHWKYAD